MPSARCSLAALFSALALLAVATPARANGRFPTARHLVVGPGAESSVLALQATFGIVVSRDRGRTWHNVCEPAIGFDGMFDPPIVLAPDGALLAGVPDGLVVARGEYCGFERVPGVARMQIEDLAADATGRHVIAVASVLGRAETQVLLSDDAGASWREGWRGTDLYVTTVDFAPSDHTRAYVSGFTGTGLAVLYRSDDGGVTFRETTRDFAGGFAVHIAAVDPTRPDVLFVRSNLPDAGTILVRSTDGGLTFREVVRTTARMTGFARSDDGMRLWVGSPLPNESVIRSTDGGNTWRIVATGFGSLCMAWHAGTLYVCGAVELGDFAVGCSVDEGESFTSLLEFDEVRGPDACGAGTPARELCGASWPALRELLAPGGGIPTSRPRCHPNFDGGVCDAGTDATAGTDAPRGLDAPGRVRAGGGCGCASAPSRGAAPGGALLALGTAVLAARTRRRRRGAQVC